MPEEPVIHDILYVDDDESLVFLVTRMLEQRGYRVSAFTEPLKAIDAVRAAPQDFALVVSDYIMPGSSGLDVARAVRAIRADLPVVIVTGYATVELAREAAQAGASEVLSKPHVAEEFIDALVRFIPART